MASDTVVIAIGNPLMGDDGIACHLWESLKSEKAFRHMDFEDAGTGGIVILHIIRNRKKVFIIDAADMGKTPGSIEKFSADQIKSAENPITGHHLNFDQIFRLSGLMLELPLQIVFFGIQPFCVAPGPISPVLKSHIPHYLDFIGKELLRSCVKIK